MHYLNLKYDDDIKEWLARLSYKADTPRLHLILNMIRHFMAEKDEKIINILKNTEK